MLQFSPFFEVRKADAHVAGFEPRITTSLTAVGADIAGRTFILLAWTCFVNGPLERFPSFFNCAGSQIIPRNWKGRAEVHLPIRSNREAVLAAGAFNKTSVR